MGGRRKKHAGEEEKAKQRMRKESREREKKDKEIIGSHYFKVFKTRNTAIKNIFLVMSFLIKQSQKARSKSTTQEKI